MCGSYRLPEPDPDMDRRFEVTIWYRDRSSHLGSGGPDPWHPIDTFYVVGWCMISGALKQRSDSSTWRPGDGAGFLRSEYKVVITPCPLEDNCRTLRQWSASGAMWRQMWSAAGAMCSGHTAVAADDGIDDGIDVDALPMTESMTES